MKPTENGWDKETIQSLLDTNDRAVERAVVAIYKLQTLSERESMHTTENNGQGFTKFDSVLLTSLAKDALYFGGLTNKQVELARKRVRKYWKQLLSIAATSTVSNTAKQYERMSRGY